MSTSPEPRLEIELNLRTAQVEVARQLSTLYALDITDFFEQLIDLAVLPAEATSELPLAEVPVEERTRLGLGSNSGKWRKIQLTLDADHAQRVEAAARATGVSRSRYLRHLLSDYLDGVETLAPPDSDLSVAVGGALEPQRVVLGLGAVLALALLAFVMIGEDDVVVISNPAWAKERATVILDHHTHTTFSDGSLSQGQLVSLAQEGGCDALVVSDHAEAIEAGTAQQLEELARLRLEAPDLLLFSGLELNVPEATGDTYLGLIVHPALEGKQLPRLHSTALANAASKGSSGRASALLGALSAGELADSQRVIVYNHPSRGDTRADLNFFDIQRWRELGTAVHALAGAPGHQNAREPGNYTGPLPTEDRWDPAVAQIGGTLDQLWSRGYRVWGALASSDYHAADQDKRPCAFSRTHVVAPERSYGGVIQALRAGTFWADQGRILDQFWFGVGVEGREQLVFPGSTTPVGHRNATAVVTVEIERGPGSIGQPLKLEVIGNCKGGEPEILAESTLTPEGNSAAVPVPLAAVGQDAKSCYLRGRIRMVQKSGPDLMAYANPVQFLL